MKKLLDKNWAFRLASQEKTYATDLPATQYGVLLKEGVICDPFYRDKEKELRALAEEDVVFIKSFEIEKAPEESTYLVFEQIDTVADISLNGKKLDSVKNAFREHRYDVTSLIKQGENSIEVYIYSPTKYIREQNAVHHMPINTNGLNGCTTVRKPECHFGWDWGPIIPIAGITNSVYLTNEVITKRDFFVKQTHENGVVTINVQTEKQALDNVERVTFREPNGKEVSVDITAPIVIKNPELWWTNDMGASPLYTLTIYGKHGEEITILVGLRTIELDRTTDAYGNNFTFILNGEKIFMKGGNWIPPDSIIDRWTEDKESYFINVARQSNFNVIRVWGGGYYASDSFYDKCASLGILVWQDLMYACFPAPLYDQEYHGECMKELEYTMKNVRNHTALAVICGNNEIEAMAMPWQARKTLLNSVKKFFYEDVPTALKDINDVTPYIPGSPVGKAFLKGINADNDGDTHLWHVWHGLQDLTFYRTRFTRFCSEFGLESFPDMRTMKEFCKQEDLELESKVMLSHQKCAGGNAKMLYYATTRFVIPRSFEGLVYVTQLIQAEGIKDATLHWRRNRGQCNGAIYWQYNDCWACPSWSSIDWKGRWKALQHYAVKFNKSQLCTLHNEKRDTKLTILNDSLNALDGQVELKVESFDGEVLYKKLIDFSVEKTSAKEIFNGDLREYTRRNSVIVATLFNEKGEEISREILLARNEYDYEFTKNAVDFEIKEKDGKAIITLTANSYARGVYLNRKTGHMPFSDNFFDMLKGETREISIDLEGETIEEFTKNFYLYSYGDIEPKQSRKKDRLYMWSVKYKPLNFIQALARKWFS